MTIQKQAGFSMIEVMISVFVLALGVLGAAGMQLSALRTTQQSTYQTAAVELASEMADKMRANSTQMKSPSNPFLGFDFQAAAGSAPESPSTMCYGNANCSSEDLAKFDIYEWKVRLANKLPSGRAVICQDDSPWNSSARALNWDCPKPTGGGTALIMIKIGWQAKNPDGTYARGATNQFPPLVALAVEPYVK